MTLQKESYWNTELIERYNALAPCDESNITVEIFYFIESIEGTLILVNIGSQMTTPRGDRVPIALIKLDLNGGHLHVWAEKIENGVNVLPEFLHSLDRSRHVTFFSNVERIDPYIGNHIIYAHTVHFTKSHDHRASFWDAMAHLLSFDYDESSCLAVTQQLLMA